MINPIFIEEEMRVLWLSNLPKVIQLVKNRTAIGGQVF